ncbi:MAG: CotH kinase family protein [Balneolia bacterium]|nr:CotH kinase family protein [Balneolia bacterium]
MKYIFFSLLAALLLFVNSSLLQAQSGPVLINEFMSSNGETIADEDGDYEDWIELYNAGDSAVNLEGFGLSDDYDSPFRWVMPDVTIQPGEFLLVWASGKHRTDPSGELHTNFSISSSGEELLLTAPDGTRIDEIAPLPVPRDISYGRFPDGSSSFYFFDTPTPGSANSESENPPMLGQPEFSVEGRTYSNPFELTLTANAEAQIYYTLDGSVPHQGTAQLYSGPITVSGTHIIRAKAFKDGFTPSPPASQIFNRLSSSVQDFSSDLPLMIINSYGQPIIDEERRTASISIIEPHESGRTPLLAEEMFTSRMEIDLRGSSSLDFPKNNMGFHLWDEFDGNRNESLLGLPSEHNWTLHGPYADYTLMRNVVSYQLSEDMGWYAPRTRYVELFLHQGNGEINNSHYHGVYVLVERIKWDNNRVDIEKLTPEDNQEPEISGGYIIKKDRLNPGDSGFNTRRGTLLAHARPQEADITPQQQQWIRNYMSDFEDALYGPQFADPAVGYEKYINVDSFIDHFLHTEFLKEIDGYRLSTFMYKDRGGKLVMGPVWDYNLALGIGDYVEGWLPQGWYYPLMGCYIGCAVRNWYVRLMEDPGYNERMQQRWWQLRQTAFSREHLMGLIDNNVAKLHESQQRNFERWPVLGTYVWPNWYIGQTWEEEVEWMKDWLDARITWMDSQMGTPPEIPEFEPFSFSMDTDSYAENFSEYRGSEITLPDHMFIDWDRPRLSDPFTGVGVFQSSDPSLEYGNFTAYTSDTENYSFGIRERAPEDLRDARLYFEFTNNTDEPLTHFEISYDVEAWYIGDRRNRIRLKYDDLFDSDDRSVFETDIFSTDNPSSVTEPDSKTDGALPEHRTSVEGIVDITAIDNGSGENFEPLQPGETAWFRWQFSNTDGDGGELRSGLAINNVYIRAITDPSTSTPGEDLPRSFSLSQNYPNPFNPVTNIEYSLPEAVNVTLEVYNIAGQRVATLVSEQQSAGQHTISFDASRLSSGVYVYRLRAGSFVQTKKMMLVK